MENIILLGYYLTPILSIVFCLNLVAIMKKIKNDEKTTKNTFWMTVSFVVIVWTIITLGLLGA